MHKSAFACFFFDCFFQVTASSDDDSEDGDAAGAGQVSDALSTIELGLGLGFWAPMFSYGYRIHRSDPHPQIFVVDRRSVHG